MNPFDTRNDPLALDPDASLVAGLEPPAEPELPDGHEASETAGPNAGSAAEHAGPAKGRRRMSLGGRFARSILPIAIVSAVVASGTTYAAASVLVGNRATSTAATVGVAPAQLTSVSGGSLVASIATASESVVEIDTTVQGGFGQSGQGVGTAIVVGGNGIILTNAHVVAGATSITVVLPSGQKVDGTVYGTSTTTDLAIVKVNATGLKAATLDFGSLAVGQTVVAIGTPLGEFADSVTAGIVSGLDRSIAVENENLSGLIQTDASVNPGNSGGPLIDAAGNVVGVVTASSSSAQGISFAIPISAARTMIAEALAGESIA